MSVVLTILWMICIGACAIVFAWAAFLAGAIALFSWQEKRPYRLPDRQRAEGF
jgi:hypothetical protein